MVVTHSRRLRRNDAQIAGHPQVQQQGARLELEQQVLGAPSGAHDALTGHLLRQIARHRPAQPRLVDLERDNAAPQRVGPQAPARRFDFRQFGQARACTRLLDLRLFVGDVLARQGVELAHFQLVRVQALVLGRYVEVAGSGRGQQLDLLAHGGCCLAGGLELVALGAQLGDDLVDAALLDGAHAAGGQPQGHPALFRLDPEALRVQVGQKAPALLVVSVGDSVPHGRLLAGDLANAGHTITLRDYSGLESRRFPRTALYTSLAARSQVSRFAGGEGSAYGAAPRRPAVTEAPRALGPTPTINPIALGENHDAHDSSFLRRRRATVTRGSFHHSPGRRPRL